jgi:dTDP-glucose 4,6-dehydratase
MREKKKILVTGEGGFIGTNFNLRALAVMHWRILNLGSLTYTGNAGNFKDLSDDHRMRYGFTHGDIRDDALLDRLFDEEAFDGVIHFGAESHVDRSILGPTASLETNVIGTFRLLEGALRYWRKRGRPENFRFLHISTDEVYGSLGGEGRFTEKTPYDPSSP